MRSGSLGQVGEEVAARYLSARGMRVVARNWRCAVGDLRGEIDLVAWDGPVLVVCEVKARRGLEAGGPLAAVTRRKQQQLRRLAGVFLAQHRLRAAEVRFDVVGVCWPPDRLRPEISHVRGAW
jgi:putative endonuclease